MSQSSQNTKKTYVFYEYEPERSILSTQPKSKVTVNMEKQTSRKSQIIGAVNNLDAKRFATIVPKAINFKSVDKHISSIKYQPPNEKNIGRDLGHVFETHQHLEYENWHKNLDNIQKKTTRNVFIDEKRVIPRHKHFYNYSLFGKIGNTDGKSKSGRERNKEEGSKFFIPPSTCQHDSMKQRVDKNHCRDVHDFGKSGRDNIRVCGKLEPTRSDEEWWGGVEELDYLPRVDLKEKPKVKGMITMRHMLPRTWPDRKGRKRNSNLNLDHHPTQKRNMGDEGDLVDDEEFERSNNDRQFSKSKEKKNKVKCFVNMRKATGRNAVMHLGMNEQHVDANANIENKNKRKAPTLNMLYSGTTRYKKKSVENQIKSADMLIMHSSNAINVLKRSFPI